MARRKVQEWCHACSSYQDFEYDPDDLGEQVILCPNCGHEHYRRAWDGQLVCTRQRAYTTYTTFTSCSSNVRTFSTWTFNSTTGYFYPNN